MAIAAGIMGIGELIQDDSIKAAAAKRRGVGTSRHYRRYHRDAALAEWAADFEAADVPFAPARLTEEGMTDEQIIHNEMVVTLKDPVGPIDQMGVPIQLSGMPGRVKGARIDIADAYDDLPPDYPEPYTGGVPSGDGPIPRTLTGIRILEILNLIAGPTGGRLLGDLGADVIKLQPLTGDLSRPIGRTYFYNINFNKRSISIDTSTDAGKNIVQRVAATADALQTCGRHARPTSMGIGGGINRDVDRDAPRAAAWTGRFEADANRSGWRQALMGTRKAARWGGGSSRRGARRRPAATSNGAMAAPPKSLALFVHRVPVGCSASTGLLNSERGWAPWFTRYAGKLLASSWEIKDMALRLQRLYRLKDGRGAPRAPRCRRNAPPYARRRASASQQGRPMFIPTRRPLPKR